MAKAKFIMKVDLASIRPDIDYKFVQAEFLRLIPINFKQFMDDINLAGKPLDFTICFEASRDDLGKEYILNVTSKLKSNFVIFAETFSLNYDVLYASVDPHREITTTFEYAILRMSVEMFNTAVFYARESMKGVVDGK